MPGRLRILGDDGNVKRIVTISVANDHLVVESPDGSVLMDVESHGSRHAKDGADPLPLGSLKVGHLSFSLAAGTQVSIDAGASVYPPPGIMIVFCDPNVVVEAYDDVAGTWKTIIPAGGSGVVVSDSQNIRVSNTGTASATYTYRLFL